MANLKLTLRFLDMVLGLPAGSVSAVRMAPSGNILDVTVAGLEYAEDAEVQALDTLHDCGGERWYRTEVTVPEPVARKVEIPASRVTL